MSILEIILIVIGGLSVIGYAIYRIYDLKHPKQKKKKMKEGEDE